MAQGDLVVNLSSEEGMTLLAGLSPFCKFITAETPALHTHGSSCLCKESNPPFLETLEQGKPPLKQKVSKRCTHVGFLQGKPLGTDPSCIPPSPSADRQTEGVPEQWYPSCWISCHPQAQGTATELSHYSKGLLKPPLERWHC